MSNSSDPKVVADHFASVASGTNNGRQHLVFDPATGKLVVASDGQSANKISPDAVAIDSPNQDGFFSQIVDDAVIARVYMAKEAAENLYADHGPGVTLRMMALSIDDGDVFHLEPASLGVAGVGAFVPCAVQTLARQPHEQAPAGHGKDPSLTVRLWPEADGVSGDAALLSSEPGKPGMLHLFEVRPELNSRACGLLETEVLRERTVAVVGLGSGGSPVALALAQAGVGRMILIDHDRLEVANVARHVCGIGDLGRLKTRAVADLLRGKNPFIEVQSHEFDITRDEGRLECVISDADLIIAATDSDVSRFRVNGASLALGIPALFGRALSRAAGGDVLRVRPHQGPCLACIFTDQFIASRPREYSGFAQAQQAFPAYTSEQDLLAVVQVGLASDIAPIANMIVKLGLLELSRGRGGGIDSLSQDLTCNFYTWANRREGAFKDLPYMGDFVDQMSILRWYGVTTTRRHNCLACGTSSVKANDDFFGPPA